MEDIELVRNKHTHDHALIRACLSLSSSLQPSVQVHHKFLVHVFSIYRVCTVDALLRMLSTH